MSSTAYTNGTVVQPAWLNDVDTVVYKANPNVFSYGVTANGSTDDTTAFQSAITGVLGTGVTLNIPYGTVLTTASITNLHSVIKTGNGSIKRGTDTFYFTPTDSQTNTIYVSTTGNDANDGITSAQPVATLARAYVILALYNQVLGHGNWTISLAAGTYSQSNIDFPVILSNKNRVTVTGPVVAHPGVPTVIFDGASTGAYGLNFNSRAFATIQYIKFQNYTTYGSVSQDNCDLLYQNVHVAAVPGGPGIKMQQGRLRVQGGIIQTCQTGINCIGGTTFTIGGTSTADSTQILNCTQQAILAQEQSSGHADYLISTGNPVGLDATVHSRFHAQGCVITGSVTAGVRCADGSSWFDNGTSANFSGNTNNQLIYNANGEINRMNTWTVEQLQTADTTFVTHTGTITQDIVKTYSSAISSGDFNSSIKSIRFIIAGELTGVAGTKNITVNLAGSPAFGFTIPAAATGSYVITGLVRGTGASAQTYRAVCDVSGQTTQVATGSRSISMITGSPIAATILNQQGNAADSITTRSVEIWNAGGC
jgi:hypothetical protein